MPVFGMSLVHGWADGAADATTDAAELDTGSQRAVWTATGDAA